jgi:hypothetical protein
MMATTYWPMGQLKPSLSYVSNLKSMVDDAQGSEELSTPSAASVQVHEDARSRSRIGLSHYPLHLGIKILQNARCRSVLRMDMGVPFGVLLPPP